MVQIIAYYEKMLSYLRAFFTVKYSKSARFI